MVIKFMDRFPEAFDRFENDIDIYDLESASELISSFAHWAGFRYIGTQKQLNAIRKESEKRKLGFNWSIPIWIKKRDYGRYYTRGFGLPSQRGYEERKIWRYETVSIKGKIQDRYRDLKSGRFIKKP